MTELVIGRATLVWQRLRGTDPVWLAIVAILAILAIADPARAPGVIATAAAALAGTAPYIAIAVVLIGLLRATGAEGVLAEAFKGREVPMIVMAALAGGLAPFCSCEVIPFVAALLAAGTPLSAVMAFWLSSPLMDPPQFFITMGALGAEFAVAKVIAAVAIGLAGGFVTRALMARGAFADPLRPRQTCGGCCGTGKATRQAPVWRFWPDPDRRAAFRAAALENLLFLGKWLTLAYLLEGLMIHYVPADAIAGVVGGQGIVPIAIAALAGAPAYLNGYAAPALVSGLMESGMSAGAALAFMVGGAVTSIPAMAAVFALVRWPVFAAYLALGIGGAIASGILFGAVTG